ncbi:hypothetical protein K491DRAFT_705954 [Lophiostoma macrostomum CBS 122681]|uniref:Uncharacterized protein n=1 Tax=Lophiostoma macrostomum CBS 122681 TaxID=1314788 RepID=A0A6A6T1U0_9PLEO|nr:hypothetical protein K491DRAFT_705954 [Lophiostoma macrostomum CBS 122681]
MTAAGVVGGLAFVQAFRPARCEVTAALSVSAFLVPALTTSPPTRPFSSSRRRRREALTPKDPRPDTSGPQLHSPHHSEEHQKLSAIRIPLPPRDVCHNIQTWLVALDPYLPPPLRRRSHGSDDVELPLSNVGLGRFLLEAQKWSLDLLSHIGIVESRWETVVWVTKKIVQDEKHVAAPQTVPDLFSNVSWPESNSRSLNDLTDSPLVTNRVMGGTRSMRSLDDFTSAPETIEHDYRVVKEALGQVWRSLGNMILIAAREGKEHTASVLPHALELIAFLHHSGIIPDSVYTNGPPKDEHALHQPPTLHLLSSKILTALSDATWRAHEASVKVAIERLNASYFLGHEIPGSRFKMHVTEIAPELWLELVLWSCLHGGWIVDGAVIAEQALRIDGDSRWELLCWRERLQAEDEAVPASRSWRLFKTKDDAASEAAEARALTQKRISSEVVVALIEGLVNAMRVGVGTRGTEPEVLLGQIKNLKQALDRNSLSLGSATWDSVIVRMLESGGIAPNKRPNFLLSIMDLATGFGSEVSTTNAYPLQARDDEKLPYFFEPSAASLGLLHRTMQFFLENGDIAGAMTSLNTLQDFTDANKQKSLQQFFEALKGAQSRKDQPLSGLPTPIEFPAFDPQLPVTLLAKTLDLTTQAKRFELGRWLLLSEELDGPLIGPELYKHRGMAASIIRFGTMAGENDLVLEIVKQIGFWDAKTQTQQLPHQVFTALLTSQIQLQRWESVQGMQNYVLEKPGYVPQPDILATFGAELLRVSGESSNAADSPRVEVQQVFKEFLFAWEEKILTHLKNELHCVLGILSTTHVTWKEFCSQFLGFSARQGIRLSTSHFNQVLGGVLDGYGSIKGREIVDMWCYKPPNTFGPFRAPGGLPTMPRFRVGKGEEYESRPEDIEIEQPSGAKLILQGRIHADRQTIWAILRRVELEVGQSKATGSELTMREREETRETLQWAARLLYYLGYDHEDIIRLFGSLAELAELKGPLSFTVTGVPDGE